MKAARIFSFGIAALVFTVATASANITPVFVSDPVITSGNLSTDEGLDSNVVAGDIGDYLYSYTFQLDSQQQIVGGQSAICLDELQGLIAGLETYALHGVLIIGTTPRAMEWYRVPRILSPLSVARPHRAKNRWPKAYSTQMLS